MRAAIVFSGLFFSSYVFAGTSYVCESNAKSEGAIHLAFSGKAPSQVGYARVNDAGKERSSGKLSCTEDSHKQLKCAEADGASKDLLLISGDFENGSSLSLKRGVVTYNCKPWTQVNINAAKFAE